MVDAISTADLPSWFLDNCVLTSLELQETPIPLVVRRSVGTGPEPTGWLASQAENNIPRKYEIEGVIYDGLRNLLAYPEPVSSDPQSSRGIFSYNAAIIRNPFGEQSVDFLLAVTKLFANSVGADLIIFSKSDLEYLQKQSNATDTSSGELQILCDKIIDAARQKVKIQQNPETKQERRQPLVVTLLEMIADSNSCSCCSPKLDEAFLEVMTHLRDAVNRFELSCPGLTTILAIDYSTDELNSSSNYRVDSDNQVLSKLGSRPSAAAHVMIPVRSEAQNVLFEEYWQRKRMDTNIRKIQKEIRDHNRDLSKILQPAALNKRKCRFLVNAIGIEITKKRIGEAFDRLEAVQNSLEELREKTDLPETEESELQGGKAEWKKFHGSARKALEEIERESFKYEWERKLVDACLVSPDQLMHTWADVYLDHDVKHHIKQVINLAESNPETHYGLLRQARINGALLYGPPGTGKTQLARVLACEYKAVMIHVTPAEIEQKWAGESEKIIKALFNLGRMLAPSIIFIDEADSIFRSRQEGDQSYVRNQLNMLLNETDGLVSASHPPFCDKG
ncbi:hypothetical protein F4859DRAFT_519990 [Xylaria cf. heliscus]|nr:hypothetical protein F4859DRAFT_519990 [Xylaria cf. heliscus]